MIVLQPRIVTKVGDTNQSTIEFKLDSTEDEENIILVAEYTVNGNKFVSDPVLMPSLQFAEVFSVVIYEDKCLDDTELIKDAKEQACKSLTAKLMDNNVLLGGTDFIGFGFVFVENNKVLTVEKIEFSYKYESNRKHYTAVIRNCVGNVSFSGLNNPTIEFWTGRHKVKLHNPQVTKAIEGRLKDYELSISDITISVDNNMPAHTVYDKLNFNNEDFLEAFIKERNSLLDNLLVNDLDLDDRFDDLF